MNAPSIVPNAAERAQQLHNMWLDYLVLRGDGDLSAPAAFVAFTKALRGATQPECDAFLSIIREL